MVLVEGVRDVAAIVNGSSLRSTMRSCSFTQGIPVWGSTLGVGVSLLCDWVDSDSLCAG